MTKKSETYSYPIFNLENKESSDLLVNAYNNAIYNLIEINTVDCDETEYNSTGLIKYPGAKMFRAGGDYPTPWTRDSAINSWNAGSIISPEVAKNTLYAVCKKQLIDGKLIINPDNQWWDKIIWVIGAYDHYLVTGDRNFLEFSYEVGKNTILELRETRFNHQYELFMGPSFFNDGISGYPEPLYDPYNGSPFVLDHPYTDRIMCLSTNCIYYKAYMCLHEMGKELNKTEFETIEFKRLAHNLSKTINLHLWDENRGLYNYFIFGEGKMKGKVCEATEASGVAFAIMFGIADEEKVRLILKNTHIQPKGIPSIYPHFQDFSEDRQGRHNAIIWPVVQGFWADACFVGKRLDLFENEMRSMASISANSNDVFYEMYNSITGEVDGGYQVGRHWRSVIHQTWSATAYLRCIYLMLFGLTFTNDSLIIKPMLPKSFGNAELKGLKYRDCIINISLKGSGNNVKKVFVNDKEYKLAEIKSDSKGEFNIIIDLE